MMTNRLNDYLAGEATDYLEELDELLASSEEPDHHRFLQLATGVRGSTQMAGADSIARLAGRVEEAARSIADSHVRWSEEVRSAVRRALADVRSLVGSLGQWGPDQEEQVQRSLERWHTELGERYADSRPAVPIDTLFYDDDGPHIVAAPGWPPESAEGVVPIERLLLRGDAALREALTLRPAFEALARAEGRSDGTAGALVEELFELLELGLQGESPGA